MKDAGIIGFVPRGEYSSTETYDFLQFVYYKGSTYVAKKETTGNAPVENNEFWQILAKGEVQAVTGVKGDSEEKYRQGDVNLTAENIGALPVSGGTLSNDGDSVSIRFKIPKSEKEVMLTVFPNGQFEVWDDLNKVSLFKSSINGIFYNGKNLLIEGNGDNIKNKGVVEILTDINQINGTHRFWDIHTIDKEYATEIGLKTNPGDYHAIVSYYNGDGTEYKYGNLFLSTPRWNGEFYYFKINKDVTEGGKKVTAYKFSSSS